MYMCDPSLATASFTPCTAIFNMNLTVLLVHFVHSAMQVFATVRICAPRTIGQL